MLKPLLNVRVNESGMKAGFMVQILNNPEMNDTTETLSNENKSNGTKVPFRIERREWSWEEKVNMEIRSPISGSGRQKWWRKWFLLPVLIPIWLAYLIWVL